jgi:fructose-1,6-bisphosphatase/sedoheptulose 1,7-bisphosphatase-like protein
MTRGGGVDGVRRSCDARQIRPRLRDLDDSARRLSARQAFLVDGDIAEARTCAYPDGNDTICIGSKSSRENAIDIELHALHGSPAGAEGTEGGSRVLVDDLVGHT